MTALDYVQSLGESTIRLGLDRVRMVLASLGNPQNDFPAIHIAGTNGKGSVAAMVAQALKDQQKIVGLYTSPHLIHLFERYKINDKSISHTEFSHLVWGLKNHLSKKELRKTPLTQFEFLTVLAFLWFSKNNVDIAVVETGMGGRLDATNTMSRTWMTCITNIEQDHMRWLGSSPEKIAYEKAGIIKSYIPLVTGARGRALSVIREIAKDKKAPQTVVNHTFGKSLTLKGFHQKKNAALAYTVLQGLSQLDSSLNSKTYLGSIQRTIWPGRYEVFMKKGTKTKLILDGGHNTAALKALVKTLREDHVPKWDLLFGVLKDKDIHGMVKILAPCTNQGAVVPLHSQRTADPKNVIQDKAWSSKMESCDSIERGWKWIQNKNRLKAIVVTGSLYLVGAIRKRILLSEAWSGPSN